jgi:5-(carboxyamino)imidazole ribonucleotide synthase
LKLPKGATIGLLGGGQLGRMIALESERLGYKFLPWDPVAGGPAEQVCGRAVVAPFDDRAAERRFADSCQLITFEWENVPAELAERLDKKVRVLPHTSVLGVIQDRLVQREFLATNGFPQTKYRSVDSSASLAAAAEQVGYPCLLKTRRHGYDGKGQVKLTGPQDLPKAAELLSKPCVLEAFVPFIKEISVILARTEDSRTAVYPVAENVHRNGILHTTFAPARIPANVSNAAALLALAVAEKIGHVGVMACEMFWLGGDGEGQLLLNEIAPRVHNSGHYTWGACKTSQFEQHVRAIAGLALGDVTQTAPAVMINLLGDLWAGGEPDWSTLPAGAKLTLYGKAKAAPGRKMGHVVFLDDAARRLDEADAVISAVRR